MRWLTHPPAPDSEDVPFPPRLWWTRRVAAMFALYFAALIAIQVGWDWYMYDQVQRRLATWRERGEPWRAEDFGSPTADDSGVQELCDAVRQIGSSPVVRSFDFEAVRDHPALLEHLAAQIGEHLARSEPHLARVRAALRGPGFELRLKDRLRYSLPLEDLRHAADTWALLCLLEHRRGNDATAVEALLELLLLSDRIASVVPSRFTLLHASRCVELAAACIEEIAPGLETTSLPDAAGRGAAPNRVRALIERLLEGSVLPAQEARMVRFEQVYILDTLEHELAPEQSTGPFGGAGASLDARAILNQTFLVLMRPCLQREALAAADEWDWRLSGPAAPPGSTSWRIAQGFRIRPSQHPCARRASDTLWQLGRRIPMQLFESRFLLATRRMSAVALALRLCELEHGMRPARLDDLVPAYLSRLPEDPWSPQERKVKWKREAPSRLYCDSTNQRDDDGGYAMSPWGRFSMTSLDQPFFLGPDRPRIEPRHVQHLMPSSQQIQVQERDGQDDPDQSREQTPDDGQGDGDP